MPPFSPLFVGRYLGAIGHSGGKVGPLCVALVAVHHFVPSAPKVYIVPGIIGEFSHFCNVAQLNM